MRDIESLLRASDPAADTPDYGDDQRRDLLAAAITAEPRQPRRRIRIAAAAIAGALALGMGGFAVDASVAEARAGNALNEAAVNAVDVPTRPGQYWRTASKHVTIDGVYEDSGHCRYLAEGTSIWYESVDGEAPMWFDYTPRRAIKPLEGDCDLPDGSGEGSAWVGDLATNELPGSWQSPNQEFLDSLPRDVDTLRERLYRDAGDAGPGPDEEVHVLVTDVLRFSTVPADLRAALFEVLATVPGTTSRGTRIVDGVEGVVIGHRSWLGIDHLIVIDPSGGQMIGTIERDVHPSVGDLVTSFDRTVVDEIPADLQERAERCRDIVEDGGVSVICE